MYYPMMASHIGAWLIFLRLIYREIIIRTTFNVLAPKLKQVNIVIGVHCFSVFPASFRLHQKHGEAELR